MRRMEDSTALNLLTREGVVTVTLTPALQERQYAELYDIVAFCATKEEMRQCVTKAAERWGIGVKFD
jgi:hypothetical protein